MSIDRFMGDFHHHQQIPPKTKTDLEKWAVSGSERWKHSVKLPMVRPLARMIIPMKESKPGQLTNLWQYFLQAGNLKLLRTWSSEELFNGSHKFTIPWEFQQNECIRHFMPDSRQLSSQKNKPQTNTRNWGCNPKKGHIIRKLLVKSLSNPPKKQHQMGQTAWIRVDHKKYEMIFAGNDLHTYETPGPTSSIWAYAQWLNA